MARHYLDHASTAPTRPEAVTAMCELLGTGLADPSRLHSDGLATRAVIEDGRDRVAAHLGCRGGREVVFTSGATEAITAAAWGAAERGSHAVVGAVEHSAVRRAIAAWFAEVTVVGCDLRGRVDADEVLAAVRPGSTALVALQAANHEVGTRQPASEVAHRCRELDVLTLVDAAMVVGHEPFSFAALDADLVAVSAHKAGGPPGIGALLVRRGVRVRPLLLGGDQERARRAGLENGPGIVGWAAACDAAGDLTAEATRQRELVERLASVATAIDGVSRLGDATERAPHVLCLTVDGVEPQAILLALDQRGIAAHSGSSCASEDLQPSPVLEAMGVDAHHSLRFSVGWSTTSADVDAVDEHLAAAVAALRALR